VAVGTVDRDTVVRFGHEKVRAGSIGRRLDLP